MTAADNYLVVPAFHSFITTREEFHKRGISQESGNEIPVFVFPSVVVPMFKLCFSIIVYVPFAVLLLLLILHTRKSSGLKLTHLPRTYISQDS